MPAVRYPIEMVRDVPVVAAPEEIDASNADWLRVVLLKAACCGRATFVVDMSRTRLCAAAGLSVLVRAHNRAMAEGGELRLVIPVNAVVLRSFTVTGLDRLIPNFPGLDEALEQESAASAAPAVSATAPEGTREPAASRAGAESGPA